MSNEQVKSQNSVALGDASKPQANSLYSKATGYKATIMRLSTSPNKYGSYSYAVIDGDLPANAQTYGKDGRKLFYLPKLVGSHMQEMECNLAVIPSTNPNTGEVINRIVLMRSDAEIREDERRVIEAQQLAKEARTFGMTKQDVAKQYFAAKFASKFAVRVTDVEE